MTRSVAGKTVLVTGGTGSIGRVAVQRALDEGAAQVIVYARGEQKQVEIRKRSPRVVSVIGDVRDFDRLFNAMRGVDFVFHAAAMKHVPECERDPIEAIKTNVFGSENVLRAAEMRNVECVVVLSTDKAVEPSSVMGHTKALMEKLALGVERPIRVCGVRFGNVIGTDGSVIPLFERLISEGKPLTITDSRMRRYMMTPREAVDLVFTAYSEGKPGDLFVQQSGVWTIKAVAEAVALLKGVWDYPIIEIGSRPGEKLDESLISLAELPRARWLGEFVVVSRQNLATVLDPVGMSTNLCIVSSGAMLVPLIEESKEALK